MKDERVHSEILKAKSVGYFIFWFGILGAILYRRFVLQVELIEILDFFVIWFVATLVQFLLSASKGTPMVYPLRLAKRNRKYFMFLFPLVTGGISVGLLSILKSDSSTKHMILTFLLTYVGTFIVYALYNIIINMWEKRIFDEE